MTKIPRDLWSRELLLSLYGRIISANAAQLGGRLRRALCAHRWRPDRLRRESRPCDNKACRRMARVVGPARHKPMKGLCPED